MFECLPLWIAGLTWMIFHHSVKQIKINSFSNSKKVFHQDLNLGLHGTKTNSPLESIKYPLELFLLNMSGEKKGK
jgi:hypothetical protein